MLTYEAEFFVDFVIRGFDSTAGIHFDTFCRWVWVLASLVVCQKVFRQNSVASNYNKREFKWVMGVICIKQLTFSIAVGIDFVWRASLLLRSYREWGVLWIIDHWQRLHHYPFFLLLRHLELRLARPTPRSSSSCTLAPLLLFFSFLYYISWSSI